MTFIKKEFLLKLLLIFAFLSCNSKEEEQICDTSEIIAFEVGTICQPKLSSYHYGVESLSVSKQIEVLSNLDMDGMIVQIENENLSKLDDYYKNCLVKSGEFNIYDVFTTFSINNPKSYANQLKKIEAIYRTIQHQNTQLQVLFLGDKDSPNLTNSITIIADLANNYDKSLVIYPHVGYAIETAEEALSQINLINQNNVFLAVHLCHELAAGNENRIEDVVQSVSSYIKSVSISGATISERDNPNLPIWYWGIKPLNTGTYDYSPFYEALHNANYQGAIAIQNWGIHNNFNLFVPDYLPESRDILLGLSEELCN